MGGEWNWKQASPEMETEELMHLVFMHVFSWYCLFLVRTRVVFVFRASYRTAEIALTC